MRRHERRDFVKGLIALHAHRRGGFAPAFFCGVGMRHGLTA